MNQINQGRILFFLIFFAAVAVWSIDDNLRNSDRSQNSQSGFTGSRAMASNSLKNFFLARKAGNLWRGRNLRGRRGGSRRKYELCVQTSRENWTGTDDNVYLQLYGSRGNTEADRNFDDPNRNDFEVGDYDCFTFHDKYIGPIKNLVVYQEGEEGWAPKHFYIKVEEGGQFCCDWYDKCEGVGSGYVNCYIPSRQRHSISCKKGVCRE